MRFESPEHRKYQRWVMTCMGVSVLLGVIVGQLVDTQDFGKLRLIFLTQGGPVADLLLIVAAILVVIGGARLTVTLHPAGLVCLGALILLATLAAPLILARVLLSHPVSIRFALATTLEFTGAALLGVGLQRIIFPSDSQTKSRGERTKPE